MDSQHVELLEFRTVSLRDLLKKSVSIIRNSSPKTFILIALIFILPLSIAIFARSLFTIPLLSLIPVYGVDNDDYKWSQFFIFELIYPIFVFFFSLLSTAAMVFTVASIYASRPVSFSTTLKTICYWFGRSLTNLADHLLLPFGRAPSSLHLASIPKVFKRLLITFGYFSLFLILCNIFVMGSIMMYSFLDKDDHPIIFALYFNVVYYLIFFPVYMYITALWHLASVVSVLEPLSGLAAMRKSKKLLKGNTVMAMKYVAQYLVACILTESLMFEVYGLLGYRVLLTVFACLVSVGLLLVVNFTGLMVQSVFYFMCKSYHEEDIDRNALFDYLSGYVGEYVPLKGIEMQDLDI
ncbi:hypothetical protein ACHQM5_015553 [Ranunculus cassubicifolius]